jgi:hypothetical protein
MEVNRLFIGFDVETNGKYPFPNGLNGLAQLWTLVHWQIGLRGLNGNLNEDFKF